MRRTTHLPHDTVLIYLLLLPRIDGTVPGYVGATAQPRQRPLGDDASRHGVLAHRRESCRRLRAALRPDGAIKVDALWVPLEIVPAVQRDHFETLWAHRAAPLETAALNAFATAGNPAARRHFWGRGRGGPRS